MAFIDKKDPVILNIKLTTCGRQLLSTGNLTFKYFALGDSEMDYKFNTATGLDAFNAKILRPADVNPNIISYISQSQSGTTFNVIPSIPASTYIVTNTSEEIGFFQPTTGSSTGFTFIVDSNHIKQPDAMIFMSGMTTANNKTINLKKAPIYGTSGAEPAIDDLLLVKWTLTANTTGYTTAKSYPTPFLIYKIVGVTGGTLVNNNVIITVDRNLPNFSGYTATAVAGAMILYNYINFSGDTIFNMSATDYLDESVIDFFQNSQCPTIIFPFWNMSIIYTKEIAGVQPGNITYGEFNTAQYGGFVSYIQNQAPVLKKLGVIHYTNDSPANVYGEGFYLRTPRLNIPTIMWHKSTGKTLGVTLSAIGNVKLLTGVTRSLNLQYYDLADPYGNIVGKQFVDLKIFVIEDQELLFAMSYKANRSWTLPDFISNIGGGGCVSTEPIFVLSATTTHEFTSPKEFQKITTGGFDISGYTNVTEYGVQYRVSGSTGDWTTQTIFGALIVPQFTMIITGLLSSTKYQYQAFVRAGSNSPVYGNRLTATTRIAPSVQTILATSVSATTINNTGGNFIPADVWSATNPPFQFYGMQYRVLGSTTWILFPIPPTSGSSGSGTYTKTITGLAPNTNYEYRAWIQVDFVQYNGLTQVAHTLAPAIIAPTVTTLAINNTTQVSATGGGNIINNGGALIGSRGVIWGNSINPSISCNIGITSDGNGNGAFSSILSSPALTPSTCYHVRAYAINANSLTGYGSDSGFTTLAFVPQAPTVTTASITSVGENTATSGGNIANEGSSAVTSRGIVWSTSTGPTVASHSGGGITSDGTGLGAFVSSMIGLTTGTLYYVRAYAVNTAGTNYGSQLTFTSLQLPTVTTCTSYTTPLPTSAIICGNVLAEGFPADVSDRGVAYSTSHNPSLSGLFTDNDFNGLGPISAIICSLTPGAQYYARAYAKNTAGTGYGNEIPFNTNIVQATLTTTAISSITPTSAQSGGNITDDGGGSVTARGIVWDLYTNPYATIATHIGITTNGTGTGAFTSSLTGLVGGTQYLVRSYATNSAGTQYGNLLSFTATVAPLAATLTMSFSRQTFTNPHQRVIATLSHLINGGDVCIQQAQIQGYPSAFASMGINNGCTTCICFGVGNSGSCSAKTDQTPADATWTSQTGYSYGIPAVKINGTNISSSGTVITFGNGDTVTVTFPTSCVSL